MTPKQPEPTEADLPRLKRDVEDIEKQLLHRPGNAIWRDRATIALRVKIKQIRAIEDRLNKVYPRGDFDALLDAYSLLKRLSKEVDLEPAELQSVAKIEKHLKQRSVP